MRAKISSPVRRPRPSEAAQPEKALSPPIFALMAAILTVAVFAIYSQSLNFQFILDDHHFVYDPRIQSSGHVLEYFTTYVWAQIPGGPPVSTGRSSRYGCG